MDQGAVRSEQKIVHVVIVVSMESILLKSIEHPAWWEDKIRMLPKLCCGWPFLWVTGRDDQKRAAVE